MNNILDAILQLVNENTGDVCYFEEDFDPMDFSGGNIHDAWEGGFRDGLKAFANRLKELVEEMETDEI